MSDLRIDLEGRHEISFWDALIAQAAGVAELRCVFDTNVLVSALLLPDSSLVMHLKPLF